MNLGKYEFHCQFESQAILPYFKGSTFRGVFGQALKKVVCVLKTQECDSCLLKERCLYALVFETSAAIKPPDDPKIISPPHPFVIEPPLNNKNSFFKR